MFNLLWFKKKKILNDNEKLIFNLKTADFSYYKAIYSSDLSLLKIYAYKRNIIQYIKLLNKLIVEFDKDLEININVIPTEIEYIYLRDWFLDDQNNFIDVESTLKQFIEKSIILLEIQQRKLQIDDKDFNTERNLRVLDLFISNISTICRSFLSHES